MRARWLLSTLLLLLPACDSSTGVDDDDDGGGNGGGVTTTFEGFFLDDAVQGLQYRVGDAGTRVTDEFGTFDFELGQPITFLVDGVPLGTVAEGRTRISPRDFGNIGVNLARFLQSLDTRPGEPGIDLAGIDLPDTPIDFMQGNDSFAQDPAVQQALAAAATAGASGTLIDATTSSQRLTAALSPIFDAGDFVDRAIFVTETDVSAEPCLVWFRAGGTALNLCRDDILENPTEAAIAFTWTLDETELEIEFEAGGVVEERVTVTQLGRTANRIAAQVTSECLTCNPNEEQTIFTDVQLLLVGLPLVASDLNGRTVRLASRLGMRTATFVADGTGTWNDGNGTSPFAWSIHADFANVVQLRGTGTPSSSLPYRELVLTDGTVSMGRVVLVEATVIDTNADGMAEAIELAGAGTYQSIEWMPSSTP